MRRRCMDRHIKGGRAAALGTSVPSAFTAFIFQLCRPLSINTGTAPILLTAMAQEIMVKVGIITSSPSPIPNA